MSRVTRPDSPKAVVWDSPGRDVMHHFKMSDLMSDENPCCHFGSGSLTLRLQLLQLSVEKLEVRFAEVDFRQTILA